MPGLDPSLLSSREPFEVVATSTFDPIARTRAAIARAPLPSTGHAEGAAAEPSPPSELRRATLASLRAVLQPDVGIGWLPLAIRAAREIQRAHPVDLVLASAPPYSALVVAARIARDCAAKLVLDYRDPWAADREKLPLGAARRWVQGRLERFALARADLALFTSRAAREFYAGKLAPAGLPLEVLLNGIDALLPGPAPLPDLPLRWVYAGSLYGGRSLSAVFQALSRAPANARARLRVIGAGDDQNAALARSYGVEQLVESLGRMPFDRVAAELRAAHRLVAVISDQHMHSIPAKLFDYMAARRPILLLASPTHCAADLLEGWATHRVISADDAAAIAQLMQSDAETLTRGSLIDVPEERLAAYRADAQMAWLDQRLRDLLSAR